jgi:hypothetical protein
VRQRPVHPREEMRSADGCGPTTIASRASSTPVDFSPLPTTPQRSLGGSLIGPSSFEEARSSATSLDFPSRGRDTAGRLGCCTAAKREGIGAARPLMPGPPRRLPRIGPGRRPGEGGIAQWALGCPRGAEFVRSREALQVWVSADYPRLAMAARPHRCGRGVRPGPLLGPPRQPRAVRAGPNAAADQAAGAGDHTSRDRPCEASPDAANAKERAPRVGGDALSNPPGCGNWVGRCYNAPASWLFQGSR